MAPGIQVARTLEGVEVSPMQKFACGGGETRRMEHTKLLVDLGDPHKP